MVRARDGLVAERDQIKEKVVSAKPYAAQVQHYTTKIDGLQAQLQKRKDKVSSLERERDELQVQISDVNVEITSMQVELAELEHQRHQIAIQAPSPAPSAAAECTLKAMVPALDLPVEKLGEMLTALGADSVLCQSISTNFDALRELKKKAAEAAPAPATPKPQQPHGFPSQEEQQAAEQSAVPMDTDDIETLKEFYRTFMGEEPPPEEEQIRAAAKRWAAASANMAKRRRVAKEQSGAASGGQATVVPPAREDS